MKKIIVKVQYLDEDEEYTCVVPKEATDYTCILIGQGIIFENKWKYDDNLKFQIEMEETKMLYSNFQ